MQQVTAGTSNVGMKCENDGCIWLQLDEKMKVNNLSFSPTVKRLSVFDRVRRRLGL
jgi:hypothetical protein